MLIWFYPVEALLLSRLTKFVLSFYIYSPLPHNVVGYGYQYHSAMSTASKYFKWASLTLCSFQNVYSNSRNGATPFFNRWHIDLTGGLRGLLKGVAHLWKNEGVAPLRELLYTFVVPGPPGKGRHASQYCQDFENSGCSNSCLRALYSPNWLIDWDRTISMKLKFNKGFIILTQF